MCTVLGVGDGGGGAVLNFFFSVYLSYIPRSLLDSIEAMLCSVFFVIFVNCLMWPNENATWRRNFARKRNELMSFVYKRYHFSVYSSIENCGAPNAFSTMFWVSLHLVNFKLTRKENKNNIVRLCSCVVWVFAFTSPWYLLRANLFSSFRWKITYLFWWFFTLLAVERFLSVLLLWCGCCECGCCPVYWHTSAFVCIGHAATLLAPFGMVIFVTFCMNFW